MAAPEDLHHLIDELPENELPVARRFLEFLRSISEADDPVLRAFMSAPVDSEPLSSEDKAAIEEGRKAARRGELEPWAAVRAELFRRK